MKSRTLIVATVSAMALISCGRPADVADSTVDATAPSTTLLAATTLPEATLGVTPDQFIAEWNRYLEFHEFLQIGDFDTDDGTSLVSNFGDEWGLELTVDLESGELTTAELWGSMDVHTDMSILLFATLITMVEASNPNLDSGIEEAWDSVPKLIGFPLPENEPPQWLDEETYTSVAEIEGISYTFEKSGYDVVLTALPSS